MGRRKKQFNNEGKLDLPDKVPTKPEDPKNVSLSDDGKTAYARLTPNPSLEEEAGTSEAADEQHVKKTGPTSYAATSGPKRETKMEKLQKEASEGISDVEPFKNVSEWQAAMNDPRYCGRNPNGTAALKDELFIAEVVRRLAASRAAGTISS